MTKRRKISQAPKKPRERRAPLPDGVTAAPVGYNRCECCNRPAGDSKWCDECWAEETRGEWDEF